MLRRAGMVAHALARSTRLVPTLALVLITSGGSLSCSGGDSGDFAATPAAEREPDGGASAPAASPSGGRAAKDELRATATEPLADEALGGLHGVLHFEGTPPERFSLGAASSPECKHHAEVDQRSNNVLVSDGKLANVFVTLKNGVDAAKVPPPPATRVQLDQKGCMYLPRVVGLRVGQTLEVLNSDPTAHNVNLQAKRNRSSNRSMGAGQKPLEFVFDQRELGILAKCDIHPWMGAQIQVETHPWFAVSDAAGAVRISGIPPGAYTVEARHEVFGTLTGKLTISAGQSSGFEGTFQAK